jgi:uncharacterized membrane protein
MQARTALSVGLKLVGVAFAAYGIVGFATSLQTFVWYAGHVAGSWVPTAVWLVAVVAVVVFLFTLADRIAARLAGAEQTVDVSRAQDPAVARGLFLLVVRGMGLYVVATGLTSLAYVAAWVIMTDKLTARVIGVWLFTPIATLLVGVHMLRGGRIFTYLAYGSQKATGGGAAQARADE